MGYKITKNSFEWLSFKITHESASFLSNELLVSSVNLFWDNVLLKTSLNQHILFIPRISFENGQVSTLCKLLKLNVDDPDFLIEYLSNILSTKEDSYSENVIKSISFDYTFKEGVAPKNQFEIKKQNYQTYHHYKFPITMDPLQYGRLIRSLGDTYLVHLDTQNIADIEVDSEKGINRVKIFKNGMLVLEYTDKVESENQFTRTIGSTVYTFIDNKLVLIQAQKRAKSISIKATKKKNNSKFDTLDLETRTVDNELVP